LVDDEKMEIGLSKEIFKEYPIMMWGTTLIASSVADDICGFVDWTYFRKEELIVR
jgi:hypothetical protein